MGRLARFGGIAMISAAGFAATVPAAAAAGPPSTNPADWTPQMIAPTDTGYVKQLVPCGPSMFVAGTFSQFTSPADGGRTFTRNNVMAFDGATGKITAFDPNTDGTVNSIALDPADCRTAWIGGSFSTVGGQSARNIAAVDTATGALRTGFRHTGGGQVSTLLHTGGRLLAGGYFSSLNGASRAHLASLDPATGIPDNYLTLPLTGTYPGVANATRAHNFTLSHGGDRLLVTGVFTAVAGVPRQQVFQLDLGTTAATLDPWTSPDFSVHCADSIPFYLRDATFSPDDSTVYVATTGYKASTDPLHTGVCDAVAAYPGSGGSVSRRWVNYTGCDSLYSVAADTSTVYVGGHQRWLNNELACDRAGSTAVSRPGIGGVDPVLGGATSWNPTRSLGAGADDLVFAFGGLWVGSDNKYGATRCGGEYHPGICFLPY